YQIVDKVIVIKLAKAEKKEKTVTQSVEEQVLSVSGRVTDKGGIPMAGATVIEKGTLNGVTTNSDGDYSIKVSGKNSILRFSYIGFETKELLVGTQSIINIVLLPTISSLEELLVIGYGTAKKESTGSAISQIKGKDIEEKSVGAVSFEQILGGQIKGVQITQSSGAPGAAAVIRVRGITSPFIGNGKNQPLYVIDGVPFNTDPQFDVGNYLGETQNLLLSVSPNDIESFTVLKDAAATAIYGSRGANGVILINTKRGKKNSGIKTTLEYSLSLNNPVKTMDLLDAEGFKELHRMIARNTIDAYAEGNASSSGYSQARQIIDTSTGEPRETLKDLVSGKTFPVFGSANTNWQDEVYNKYAPTHQWYLNMEGGNENINYSFGISYTDQKPLFINSSFKKYGTRVGIDYDVNNWLKIGTSINYSGSRNVNSNAGASNTSNILTMRPDYAIYDENGDFLRYPFSPSNVSPGNVMVLIQQANPVAALESDISTNSTSFIGSAYAEAELFKGFTIKADVNTALFKMRGRSFQPLRTLILMSGTGSSTLNNSISEEINTSLRFQVNYYRMFEKHEIDIMAGNSWDKANFYRYSVSYSDLADDYVLTNAPSAATYNRSGEGNAFSGINSIYGRLQYSYDSKYTATLNFRRDKSSKFGPGEKVAFFPSIALNWNIDRENFMDKLKCVNKLILRTSYGQTGSANIADFAYMQYFQSGTSRDKEYEAGNTTIVPNITYPNRNLHWELTKELNAGVDFSLFSHRLYGSFDIYNKNTDGILVSSPYPLESGASSYTSNLAEISNKGWELEIGGDLIRVKDFNWMINFNLATNHNKVESIEGAALSSSQTDFFTVGQPVGVIKGYRVEKIIQEQSEIDALNDASPTGTYFKTNTAPGDYLFKDLDGDKSITTKDIDIIGNAQPDFFGGFNTIFSYKRVSLAASFQYSIGNESVWAAYSLISPTTFGNNGLKEALTNTWTPENTNATYPRLVYGYSYNGSYTSDATIQDASYLRLKNVRLNYEVPGKLLSKLFLKSAVVYISATNVFTWSNFKGIDPEASTPITAYTNYDAFPYSKTFSFGIKIGL
ncbi:MAG: TonB-dependent receptor, partial [Prolixibacteraceae bacterium]|nr:TonB-dependent receptor [Prolixibacteraceae bacterium]